VDVDIKRLRSGCESCPWLAVREEEGGDWSALFRGRHETFVDVYSPQDLYPPELWAAAAAYFGGLEDASMVLPGGRYLCAQVLARRGLPFLAGRTLGEVCHIVQLAISQKKLLGYLNGAVVPYQRSQSMVKERCAERQRPCTSAPQGKSSLASWTAVRKCLQEILKDVPLGSGSVPLSNVKRLFRSRFHLELSETALGHSKLSELLQDQRISDVCSVRLRGQGYVVAPLPREPQPKSQISLADSISSQGTDDSLAASSTKAAAVQGPPAAAGASSFRQRAKGIRPLALDEEEEETEGELPALPAGAEVPAGAESFGGLPASTPSPCSMRRGGLLAGFQRDGGAHMPIGTLSPASMRKAQSLPRLLGRSGPQQSGPCVPFSNLCGGSGELGAKALLGAAPGPAATKVAPGQGGEGAPRPLARGCKPEPAAEASRLLTPCTLGHMGFSVQNTFIHVALPPPTPPAGASCRAHSLPRNMGSGQSDCSDALSA